MPTALTENHANADFSTGLAVPANGDDSVDWFPLLIAGAQEIVDRTQRLRLWSSDTPSIHVPMTAMALGASWQQVVSSEKVYYEPTATGASIYFAIPQLPVGRKITGVTAYYQNSNNTTQPVGTPSLIALKKVITTVGTVAPDDTNVGTASDAVVIVADYQEVHLISLTGLTETVAEDAEYYVKITAESGTNSTTNGKLWGLRVHLGV